MAQSGENAKLGCELQPGLGVLAHVTSLPAIPLDSAESSAGTLGAPARAFIDWLAGAGVRYWQVLPLNPVDKHGSPYAGLSAFAGNEHLLDCSGSFADDDGAAFGAFCKREATWLEPYAAFTALRRRFGEGISWQDWPSGFRTYAPEVIAHDAELTAAAEQCRRGQFAFDCQWAATRAYANERGVQIIGDIPLYVGADSADVWAHPELFDLDADGRPAVVAGCPPDAFAADGQIWENPVYNWDACKAEGYAWWLCRLQRAFDLYDFARLDHFIGFAHYYCIPVGQHASAGEYRPGPGLEFFRTARETLGSLPLIAEDLGSLTPEACELVAACGFPGMNVVQFADGDPLCGWQPQPGKVAYTGTHDNRTLVGWCAQRYPWRDARETADALMRTAAASSAQVCIVPLQDILGLGDEARMNTPGIADGNWAWRADRHQVAQAHARLQALVALHREAHAS